MFGNSKKRERSQDLQREYNFKRISIVRGVDSIPTVVLKLSNSSGQAGGKYE